MRLVSYKTHWSYFGPAVKRKASLADFMLDVLYLMEVNGVIPPLHVLNEVLAGGGNNGGMSPGTSWRSFTITAVEYQELVEALLNLNVTEAKKTHPYVSFQRVIVDESLRDSPNYIEWVKAIGSKYPQNFD